MNKQYNHAQHEADIYQLWQEAEAFNPDRQAELQSHSTGETFTIIMPPPNANDPLHIGHAMFVSIEDILIRYHRMLGDETLWLPGTDHAGIETQYVFEKKLKEKKQSRFDFDRDTLYQKIDQYVQKNSNVAVNQIKQLGASADWSRFKFTLDEDVVDDVLTTFEKLNEADLLYRANRLVNYCTNCGTAFSDLEVERQEKTSQLYYLQYGPLTIATTRPETRFADVAIAVHPDDERYQQYHHQVLKIQGVERVYHLPVIPDEFVDPEFGTGAVKITPYHDPNDFEFWQKHKEEVESKYRQEPTTPELPSKAIDYQGQLTDITGKYQGQSVLDGRKNLVADLKKADLLVKINKKYENKVGCCYRCDQAIEPLPLSQFYIKVKPLTQPVLKALKQGEIEVFGAGHDKILQHWLEILEDWNISRQIVWGIRIPVWYDVEQNPHIQLSYLDQAGETVSGSVENLLKNDSLTNIKQGLQTLNAPPEAEYIISRSRPGKNYIQETDTFDTWFSSSQWPVVTLRNAEPGDFDRFYPTNVMETAYDILMFWVMRMLMMGKFITDELPFKQIYLHGLVRDEEGEKMSKSKGNVINPLAVTEEYGTDALRMALVIRSSAGLDKSVGEPDFKAARNLTNKMWNATRYILLSLQRQAEKKAGGNGAENNGEVEAKDSSQHQQEFIQHLSSVVQQVTQQIQDFKLGLAAETLYNEFWHWYCDQCIEQAKDGKISSAALITGLTTFLKLFHPFMPFITEALWQTLREQDLNESLESSLGGEWLAQEELLAVAQWPKSLQSELKLA